MKTTHQNNSEENSNFDLLVRLFLTNYSNRRTQTTWCHGRLMDWKYALYENKRADFLCQTQAIGCLLKCKLPTR